MRPSARKKIQREIKRSEAPCSESNNHRTADAGAQFHELGSLYRGRKIARERTGSDLGRRQACKLSIRILQTVGAGCAGGAMRARPRPRPRFLEPSESKNDTRGVAEGVLASVGIAEEPGGQR